MSSDYVSYCGEAIAASIAMSFTSGVVAGLLIALVIWFYVRIFRKLKR